jgi:hypothetical protein
VSQRKPRLVLLVALSAALAACNAAAGAALSDQPTPPGRAPDVVELVDLSTPAAQRARTVAGDAVLRQVSFNFSTRQYTFHFMGGTPRQEIMVVATPATRSDVWPVSSVDSSPLAFGPSTELRLDTLSVGPEAAAQAMRQVAGQRFGGTVDVRVAIAVVEEGQVVWYVFADVPQGRIGGKLVSPAVGLQLLEPGPVRPPMVATAAPGG